MHTGNYLATWYFALSYIVKIYGENSSRECWNLLNVPKQPYVVGNGFTCCNNMFLEHPLKPKNNHWRDCLKRPSIKSNESLADTLWSSYNCEISRSAQLGEDNYTYKEFERFYSSKYPQNMKAEVIRLNITCPVVDGESTMEKLSTFESCFIKTEESICYQFAGANQSYEVPMSSDDMTSELEVCEPVENLKLPDNPLRVFFQPCCKGEELPYGLPDVLMDFDRFDIASEINQCLDNVRNKLGKTNAKAYASEQRIMTLCQVACVHETDGFQKLSKEDTYNVDFQDLVNFKLKALSNITQTEINAIIGKYNPSFEPIGITEVVPIKKAGGIFSSMDDGLKLINFCKFQYEATAEAYRALYEYCYNEEYGKRFRDEILRNPAPPPNR